MGQNQAKIGAGNSKYVMLAWIYVSGKVGSYKHEIGPGPSIFSIFSEDILKNYFGELCQSHQTC